MYLLIDHFGNYLPATLCDFMFSKDQTNPAWSLHRLIEMMPYDFTYNNNTYELQITDNGAGYDDIEGLYPVVGWWRSNTYDDIIDCIEWLIKEGCFNKEYLEELCGKR